MSETGGASPTRVFISYRHESPEHVDRVLDLADRLRSEGVDARIDLYEQSPPQGWARWAMDEMETADFVLVVASEGYYSEFRGRRVDDSDDSRPDAAWQGWIVTDDLFRSGSSARYLPVIFRSEDRRWVPDPLRTTTIYSLGSESGYEDLYRRLTGQRKVVRPGLGPMRHLSPLPSRPVEQPRFGRKPEPRPDPSELESRPRDSFQREMTERIEEAKARRGHLLSVDGDTTEIDTEILDLRRLLRSGPKLHSGDTLGRYLLVRRLGRGGFATVWEAYDETDRFRVALKVLHGQFGGDSERRDRFERGARQMAELRHRHVVRVLAPPETEDGWTFFPMELVDGGDLRQAIAAGRISREQGVAILGRVAEALDFAHGRGVIHRDVKPSNILLTRELEPKLTDFDLVRALGSTGGTRTAAGLGTYLYAAPEAMSDAAVADEACDVYSLAATAVSVFLGRELDALFLREHQSYLQQLDLPNEAVRVLEQSLSVDPKARPSSATAMASGLSRAIWPPQRISIVKRSSRSWLGKVVALGTAVLIGAVLVSLLIRSEEPSETKSSPPSSTESIAHPEGKPKGGSISSSAPEAEKARGATEQSNEEPSIGRSLGSLEQRQDGTDFPRSMTQLKKKSLKEKPLDETSRGEATSLPTSEPDQDETTEQLIVEPKDSTGPSSSEKRHIEPDPPPEPISDRRTASRQAKAGPSEEARKPPAPAPSTSKVSARDEPKPGALWTDPVIGMRFRFIPPGTFQMGSPENEPGRFSEETRHSVTLTRGYWMGETEVTQEQWEAVMNDNPARFNECGPSCPVEKVNWLNTVLFANALSEKAGFEPCYLFSISPGSGTELTMVTWEPDCTGYRLPTEAEWERAARGETETAVYTGGVSLKGYRHASELDPIAWYGGNSGVSYPSGTDCSDWPERQYPDAGTCGTHPVAKKTANPWGLYDVLGNVREWCWDLYVAGSSYPKGSRVDPRGPDAGSGRVIRGGSWRTYARYVRAAYRFGPAPDTRDSDIGFRLARGQGGEPGEGKTGSDENSQVELSQPRR